MMSGRGKGRAWGDLGGPKNYQTGLVKCVNIRENPVATKDGVKGTLVMDQKVGFVSAGLVLRMPGDPDSSGWLEGGTTSPDE